MIRSPSQFVTSPSFRILKIEDKLQYPSVLPSFRVRKVAAQEVLKVADFHRIAMMSKDRHRAK
eukprot:3987978-Amphidinium_carterae.1